MKLPEEIVEVTGQVVTVSYVTTVVTGFPGAGEGSGVAVGLGPVMGNLLVATGSVDVEVRVTVETVL